MESSLPLADPGFGSPGRIDILLGVDVFVDVLLHSRWAGPPGFPVAFKLAGNTDSCAPTNHVATYHVSCITGHDILRQVWEIAPIGIESNSGGALLFSISRPTIVVQKAGDL